MPSLLTLSDVMGPATTRRVAARVGPGKTVAVVGDGAVGLCGVIAARRLGAEQIIMLGRHPDRIALAQGVRRDRRRQRARRRGGRARARAHRRPRRPLRARVRRPRRSRWSPRSASPGRAAPSAASASRSTSRSRRRWPTFFNNVTIAGGPAPARAYIEELLPDVLEGRIEPGRVFDRVVEPRRRARRLPRDERARGDQGDDRALMTVGILARREQLRHPVVLCLGEPERVLLLDRELLRDVAARILRGYPTGGVAVTLLVVGRPVDREQDVRIVGVDETAVRPPLRGAGAPRGGERDDMVDLYGRRCGDPALRSG